MTIRYHICRNEQRRIKCIRYRHCMSTNEQLQLDQSKTCFSRTLVRHFTAVARSHRPFAFFSRLVNHYSYTNKHLPFLHRDDHSNGRKKRDMKISQLEAAIIMHQSSSQIHVLCIFDVIESKWSIEQPLV